MPLLKDTKAETNRCLRY